jgi:hypothetical protein
VNVAAMLVVANVAATNSRERILRKADSCD